MNIYFPTAAESRKNSTIQSSNLNYRKFALDRILEYAIYHYNSFGEGSYSPEVIIMRDRVSPKIIALRTAIATRDSDLGQVTVDAALYDDKMLELPILLDKIKPLIRDGYPLDKTILDYLFVTDRSVFEKGSQETIQTICEGWLIRIGTKTLIPNVLTLVTTWVGELGDILDTKAHKKDNVHDDRGNVSEIVDEIFDALRKNYGDLYTANSADIRPLLASFDPTLLKPNAKDLTKPNAKQRDLVMAADQLVTVDYSGLVPKNFLVIDNTKNTCDALIFVSSEIPTVVPEFAFVAPKGVISKCDIQDIGPRYPKKINGKLSDTKATGTIRITVKKKK